MSAEPENTTVTSESQLSDIITYVIQHEKVAKKNKKTIHLPLSLVPFTTQDTI
jgi:hypothetical protein